jgi:hypothetical protein
MVMALPLDIQANIAGIMTDPATGRHRDMIQGAP